MIAPHASHSQTCTGHRFIHAGSARRCAARRAVAARRYARSVHRAALCVLVSHRAHRRVLLLPYVAAVFRASVPAVCGLLVTSWCCCLACSPPLRLLTSCCLHSPHACTCVCYHRRHHRLCSLSHSRRTRLPPARLPVHVMMVGRVQPYRLARSDNPRRKVSDRWFYPALDRAVRPLRAATAWLNDARQKRHPTIYFRAENSNVAETELGKTMARRKTKLRHGR